MLVINHLTCLGNTCYKFLRSLLNIKIMQKHHVVPVSLQCVHFLPSGKINEANLILVDNKDHVLIHQTLNINYLFIRNFIMKHAYKIIKDEEYYTELFKIQDQYFCRLHYLNVDLQKLHAKSIRQQCTILKDEYKVKIDIHENAEIFNSFEEFRFFHSIYCNIFIQHFKDFSNGLKH